MFKVVNADIKSGFIIYEDVFTKKRYRIIDLGMSVTFDNKDKKIFI